MKKVTTVSREFAQKLGLELEAAMQKVADKYGMAVGQRKGAYGSTMLKASWVISVVETTDSGNVIDQSGRNYLQFAEMYGLKKNALFGTFTSKTGTCQIIGLDLKKRAFPIVCRNVATGRISYFRADGLKTTKIKLAK